MANIMGLRVQEHFRISLFLVSLGVCRLPIYKLEYHVITTAKSKAQARRGRAAEQPVAVGEIKGQT